MQTGFEKKARKAPLDPPKVTDRLCGEQDSSPLAEIDLMADLSETGAPPPTPASGQVDPEGLGLGKAQEDGEQLADHQGTSLKVGEVTPDHTGDTQKGQAGSGDNVPSMQ